ncbi:methyltransferase domain-containing protein [Saccharopolyspora sp. K220]|uniref:class I SAM-dependent methyltransferase n=1 Tax=Saccharopolyspora soli TaxID=2926618 RepID=UPI001F595EAB|nr:methyltransferase domain-containing protein [Saccharopolyspora soli]MCI2417486.1 methyltransferase domain-containing protein [Saccharopolyspora soli]
MNGVERKRLRVTFNEDAERYDRSRPAYPVEMFNDLVALAPLGSNARVLEIGCGTGQATLPLARLGCTVTAVELGANLADVARRNLTDFDTARVIHAAFED